MPNLWILIPAFAVILYWRFVQLPLVVVSTILVVIGPLLIGTLITCVNRILKWWRRRKEAEDRKT